ncbi:adenylate/guanylate cyclase domain-containing protein [uncultured Shimia sp.]|uniref:adenylate/guanylate cyclase domain-containing protein n=1 Tax=uncultured Shimia sp. TaxID=573152 RepID=UPI0026339F03|nr:adenylate/guanylate cyclase domain-containing protein [uncultured Shimia sp.]
MERRLAAILAADVVGYSALMADDEAMTLTRLKKHREEVFDPKLDAYNGRLIKLIGDGSLVEFPSVVEAVRCAIDIQKTLASHPSEITLRIGVHLGDVIIDEDDVYGHGVNLAARLEGEAETGGVCISSIVHESLGNLIEDPFEDAGERRLKNISRPVNLFQWRPTAAPKAMPVSKGRKKPSVAVLPFSNLSGDSDQQFFSDGISEDIITGLSRFRTLFVVSRNSSFRFRESDLSEREIADKLGVQYLVEGSVRKAGNRVRVSARLISVDTGRHLWAERYDRDLEDIFAVQDEVTQSIVAVLPGLVQSDVADNVTHKPTDKMQAYELLLKGKALRDGLNAIDNARAKTCFERALEIDPDYARVYMYLADTYVVDLWLGLADTDAPTYALEIARKGAALDNRDVYIQDQLGYAYLCARQWDQADKQFQRTLSLIENEAESMAWCGYGFLLLGQADKARDVVVEAMRLDPMHPPSLDWIMGQIYFFLGRYDDAVSKLIGEARLNSLADAVLVAAYAQSGRQEEAETALRAFVDHRQREYASRGLAAPNTTLTELAGGFRAMWRHGRHWDRLADGLRRAGLPD